MKLKDYIKALQNILEEHGDLQLVYSIDSEGNSFEPCEYLPSIGFYQKEEHNFIGDYDFEEWKEEYEVDCKIDAICLN